MAGCSACVAVLQVVKCATELSAAPLRYASRTLHGILGLSLCPPILHNRN